MYIILLPPHPWACGTLVWPFHPSPLLFYLYSLISIWNSHEKIKSLGWSRPRTEEALESVYCLQPRLDLAQKHEGVLEKMEVCKCEPKDLSCQTRKPFGSRLHCCRSPPEWVLWWRWGGVGTEKPSGGHGCLEALAELYGDVSIRMKLDHTCVPLSLSWHLSWELLAEVGILTTSIVMGQSLPWRTHHWLFWLPRPPASSSKRYIWAYYESSEH